VCDDLGGIHLETLIESYIAKRDSTSDIDIGRSSVDYFIKQMDSYAVKNSSAVGVNIKRGDRLIHVSLVPTAYDTTGWSGIRAMGRPTRLVRTGAIAALGPTAEDALVYLIIPVFALKYIYDGVKNVCLNISNINVAKISNAVSEIPDNAVGPVGIISTVGSEATKGLGELLNVMVWMGIGIVYFNLLPLAVTDGGVLMFLLIEAVRSKPLSNKWQERINLIFIALILLWILYISVYDILKLPEMFGWIEV